MTQEEKYKEALLEARAVLEPCLKYSKGKVREALDSIDNELKSFESEDERILRVISEAVITFFSDYANDFEDEDRDAALAWLEKHKEPENTSASTMAPSCWQKEQKPNYCHYGGDPSVERCKYCSAACSARLTEEQKPKAKAKSPLSPHELYDAKIEGISQGRQDVLDHPEQFGLQKPAEWSEEDKEKIVTISEIIEHCTTIPYSGGTLTLNKEYKKELLCFIKSLRPQYHGDVTMTEAYKMGLEAGKASSWKPSEEQMNKLKEVIYGLCTCGNGPVLKSLYEDLKKLI